MNFAQLSDYERFFYSTAAVVQSPAIAKQLGVKTGTSVIYLPRRSVDIWNTRYIITPAFPNGWTDEQRGYASYLSNAEIIYPDSPDFRGPNADKTLENWADTHDFQILKNRAQLPRAWVVHAARTIAPVAGRDSRAHIRSMQEMLYNDDYLSHDERLQSYDPRGVAWIESSDKPELAPYISGGPIPRSERVNVIYPDPQHAVLTVALERPGLVVLADIFYPGWELTIDGEPARIYRVNRMMRGAAVSPGHHTLTYSYRPKSFQWGVVITLAGLCTLVILTLLFLVKPAPRSG